MRALKVPLSWHPVDNEKGCPLDYDESDGGRVLFFEIDGLTRVVRDCHDIDEIEKVIGFTYCPVCGGRRVRTADGGYLEHDSRYTGNVQ